MTFRGRRSAACLTCRTRRIKCDKIEPECTQCARIRTVCPGYRDPLDQLFRDETVKVTRRAQKDYESHTASSRTEDLSSNSDSSLVSTDSLGPAFNMPVSAALWSFSLPVDDVAIAHFMSSYVPGSRFDYLPEMYGQPMTDIALPATIHAVSLARLAWESGQADIMNTARRSYAKALAKTNFALSSPMTAISDATLISVLLLSLFEIMIWTGTETPDHWTTHTCGALTLIKLRGKQQLETRVGRQLFTQVAHIICVDGVRLGRRLPRDLLDLLSAALQYEDECPRFRLGSLTGELANLLADISEGCMTAEEVVEATKHMDDKYGAFLGGIPPPWKYRETILTEPHPDVYAEKVHKYPSHRAAQLWNSCRMTRILLNEVMYNHTSAPSTQAQAQQTVHEMAAQICASTTHFNNTTSLPAASAATLLWPLSSVRGADLVRQDVREYAEQRLKILGSRLRIPQAERVASHREMDTLRDGLHMFYLS